MASGRQKLIQSVYKFLLKILASAEATDETPVEEVVKIQVNARKLSLAASKTNKRPLSPLTGPSSFASPQK
jgi:hypothetical protein